jgi:hypothetical protein
LKLLVQLRQRGQLLLEFCKIAPHLVDFCGRRLCFRDSRLFFVVQTNTIRNESI